MPFENFRPKPKTETAPIISENTTENKESIENQIEQETVKLDANLEVLKQQIDEMGGVEGLNNRIKNYNDTGKLQMFASGVGMASLIMLLGAAESGGMYLDNTVGTILLSSIGLMGTGLFLTEAKVGFQSWWESRKLKSLKNKAEAGGVV
jgi:hypothetical protein